MKKRERALWLVLPVVLLLLGDLLYWSLGIGLGDRLPATYWGEAQLFYNAENSMMVEIPLEDDDFGRIAAVLSTQRVTNRTKFSTISQPYFYLVLYGPEGATGLTVVENGDVAVNLPDGSSRCYDGAFALYKALSELR